MGKLKDAAIKAEELGFKIDQETANKEFRRIENMSRSDLLREIARLELENLRLLEQLKNDV